MGCWGTAVYTHTHTYTGLVTYSREGTSEHDIHRVTEPVWPPFSRPAILFPGAFEPFDAL
jgi:hypothetical protein